MLLGLIPLETANIYQNISINTKQELKRLVADYNSRLFDAMSLFKSDHPNISASFFNTHRLFRKIFKEDATGELSRNDCRGSHNCKE